MERKTLIIIGIGLIIGLCLFVCRGPIDKKLKERYIRNIEYDIRVGIKQPSAVTAYDKNSTYILLNTKEKIGYRIITHNQFGARSFVNKVTEFAGNRYRIDKIKLTDNGIEKIKEYLNMESENNDEFKSIKAYYVIDSRDKITYLYTNNFNIDICLLFDLDANEY